MDEYTDNEYHGNSKLSELPKLPLTIKILEISYNCMKFLPNLTKFSKLEILDCSFTDIKKLPILPESLKELYCGYNRITNLSNLDKLSKLEILDCCDTARKYGLIGLTFYLSN